MSNTKQYPCGASATGYGALPEECPVHGIECTRGEAAGRSATPQWRIDHDNAPAPIREAADRIRGWLVTETGRYTAGTIELDEVLRREIAQAVSESAPDRAVSTLQREGSVRFRVTDRGLVRREAGSTPANGLGEPNGPDGPSVNAAAESAVGALAVSTLLEKEIKAALDSIEVFPGDRWPDRFVAERALLYDVDRERERGSESPWIGGTLAAAYVIANAPRWLRALLGASPTETKK